MGITVSDEVVFGEEDNTALGLLLLMVAVPQSGGLDPAATACWVGRIDDVAIGTWEVDDDDDVTGPGGFSIAVERRPLQADDDCGDNNDDDKEGELIPSWFIGCCSSCCCCCCFCLHCFTISLTAY